MKSQRVTKRKSAACRSATRRLMSKVETQERAKEERELVRRRLERHRRGRWLTRPFTFAMNIKQKKDDVLSGKPRRGGKHWPLNRRIEAGSQCQK